MKRWELFRFEVAYQARRAWTWVYFAALLAILFQIATEAYTESARSSGYFFNAPFVLASLSVLAGVMGLLVTAALAGDAGARDVQTRMHALVYTAPVGEGTYLSGRFLAAFALNALILLAAPAALVLSAIVRTLPPELLGPFRPADFLAAYAVIALPGAFVGTALLFSMSVLARRASAGYIGAVLLFFTAMLVRMVVAEKMNQWEMAKILDPLGITVISEISTSTTPAQKNALAIAHVRSLLWNRAVWVGIAMGVLALTHLRFRFDHVARRGWWRRGTTQQTAVAGDADDPRATRGRPIVAPRVARAFGASTRAHQTLAIAARSFREIATSWGGFVLVALTAILTVFGPRAMNHLGIPQVPTTPLMTAWVGNTGEIIWMIVPLLSIYYAGELVWREREVGLSEIADAAPVPEWARFLGIFLGLALVLAAYQALLVAACMLIQVQLGYHDFQLGLYARILLGMVLPHHLLFAALAFVVHVLVNQKYAGHLVLGLAYAITASAHSFGIEHNLLVYGAAPDWTYSDMRGFGPSLAPWAWFQLYWATWALLLAVAAKLFWVRGRERGFAARLRSARRGLTRPTLGVAAVAAALVVASGGFVLYNTNALNAYETTASRATRRAEYERRYGRYEGIPQPRLTGTTLRVEIYPERREVEIRGSYRLVNPSGSPIDSIHVAPDWDVETAPVELDRPATLVVDDAEVGHRIYALATPLAPGDSLRLGFRVRFAPRGFGNDGVDPAVASTATFFEGHDWLPAIGYRRERELSGAGERRTHGLPERRAVPALDDVNARHDMNGAERIAVDAVVGTTEGQTAVAPGTLRRTWTEHGRRYFHYVTDVPIRNDFAIASARYAVRKARWKGVSIEVLHDPDHPWNVDRTVRSAQASLEHFSRLLGPYPYREIRFVEYPGQSPTLHASPVNVTYQEGFALLNADADPRRIDFPFAVVAHEMAHQWWGNQLTPADVEGAPLLTESLAWYSAMSVVQATFGEDHLRRLLGMMHEAYLAPRSRAGLPLLRSYDRLTAYRKGPFAMYALREYVGAARVDGALRRLFERHAAGTPPLPTSLDLYRELQAVTPDSLRPLLADLFERNTYWELAARQASAERTADGAWRVTLDVRARKTVVDTAGVETEVPMNDVVEIGVFGPARDGAPGAPLYRRTHRIRAGDQRITVTVPARPAQAGIDPRSLLLDVQTDDDVVDVRGGG